MGPRTPRSTFRPAEDKVAEHSLGREAINAVGDLDQQKKDLMSCEAFKAEAITKSARVQFMLRAMGKLGCGVDPWKFVNCVPCVDQITGATHTKESGEVEICMCQNRIQKQNQFDTVLTHELIHSFDMCRAHVDFTKCEHHACTEIRAANLSGDCHWTEEISRGKLAFREHHNRCVRRRAILSVSFNPECGKEKAVEAVDKVFKQCVSDTAPFYAIP